MKKTNAEIFAFPPFVIFFFSFFFKVPGKSSKWAKFEPPEKNEIQNDVDKWESEKLNKSGKWKSGKVKN